MQQIRFGKYVIHDIVIYYEKKYIYIYIFINREPVYA
jgi:hypothetical protein